MRGTVALVKAIGGPWLGRYLEPDTIRADGAFHRFATRRVDDGTAVVVVVPGPGVEPLGARTALAALARAHGAISHPRVPRAEPMAEHEGTPFVELACDATMDGIEIVSRLMARHHRLPYAEAEALSDTLHEVLRAGLPHTLGRLSLASLLVSPSGRLWVQGFGHRIAIDDERGEVAVASAVFQAPEVALGATPTPRADFVAAFLSWRSLLPQVDVPDALARVLRGEAKAEDAPLSACLCELDARFTVAAPGDRSEPEVGLALLERMRRILAVTPDPDGLARSLSEIALGLPLDGEWDVPAVDEPTEESIALGPDASWIDSGRGERLKLGPSLRNMLALLLARHRDDPQRTASTWELLEAGWPGEMVQAEAGANRVYAALKRLRHMGLRSAIERHDDGYRIVPLARITLITD